MNLSVTRSTCADQIIRRTLTYTRQSTSNCSMDVLTGILVDVSGSMAENVDTGSVGQTGGSWAKSIFKFIDRLITHDSSPDHRVFVIGFGSSRKQETFDVLTTLKSLESGRRPTCSKRDMLREAMIIIEINGAPRVLTWATIDEISAQIDERQTSMLLHVLKNKQEFRIKFIYECLPASCRQVQHSVGSYVTEFANWGAGFFPGVHQAMTEDKVSDVINKGMKLAGDYILADGTYTAVYSAKDASENLRGAIGDEELTEQRTNELYERVKPYIYGGTPLMKSLHQAVKLFKANKKDKKHQYMPLFVLSDGAPTDGCYPPSTELAELGVSVVCCYITRSHIDEPRRLYSSERSEWDEEAKFMFRMSSSIPTQKIPRTVFVKRDWQIDMETKDQTPEHAQKNMRNNETRLFFQINHPDMIDEVCDFAKNCVCSQDSLADVLSSVSLDLYINKANEGFLPKTQVGKTCYAVASATVIHLSMKRIVGREGGCPDFYKIRDELIAKYGKENAKVGEVLNAVCPKYRLKCQKIDEHGALRAIVEKRPVVAIFQLSDEEWKSFYTFYDPKRGKPRGILTKDDLGIRGGELRGHAVVLTSFNSESLRLMNSKGSKWGDGGFFRVQNAAVLGLRFYDVFWTEEDLLPAEKEAYRREGAGISAELMRSLTSLQKATYKCPLCLKESNVSDFKGHLLNAVCPKCEGTFNANVAGSDLALNIYLTSLLAPPVDGQ